MGEFYVGEEAINKGVIAIRSNNPLDINTTHSLGKATSNFKCFEELTKKPLNFSCCIKSYAMNKTLSIEHHL